MGSGHLKKHSRAAHLRELQPNDTMELTDRESSRTVKAVALMLQAARPWHMDKLGDPGSSACLAEAFLAYAAEQKPSRFSQWTSVLLEVMADAGTTLMMRTMMMQRASWCKICTRAESLSFQNPR